MAHASTCCEVHFPAPSSMGCTQDEFFRASASNGVGMSRQSKWFRELVARIIAEGEAERAQKMAPPPKQLRMTTEHAREYQRLNQYPYPPTFYIFTCGARTRAGTPCKRRDLWSNGRCKFHGGLSTGPRTEQGRRQSAENGRKGGRPRKSSAGEAT